MENAEFDVTYEHENVHYNVAGDRDLHFRLQNDAAFATSFFRENSACMEIVGVGNEENIPPNTPEFTWTRACTLLLIRLYEEQKNKFRDPKIKNKNIWMEILQEFRKKGYMLDINTIDRKFRNLKKTYKTIKDNKSKNKTGRGRVTWDYYDEIEGIFVDDQSVNPQYTLSSSEPAETNSLPHSSTSEPLPLPSTSTAIFETSPLPATPSVQKTPQKPLKSKRAKELQQLRKGHLAIESQRVEEIRKLREAIEDSNVIQRERNDILRELLNKEN